MDVMGQGWRKATKSTTIDGHYTTQDAALLYMEGGMQSNGTTSIEHSMVAITSPVVEPWVAQGQKRISWERNHSAAITGLDRKPAIQMLFDWERLNAADCIN